MKKEDLFDAITDIDDRLIDEAATFKFKNRQVRIAKITRYFASAAAIIIIGILGITAIIRQTTPTKDATSILMTANGFVRGEETEEMIENSLAADGIFEDNSGETTSEVLKEMANSEDMFIMKNDYENTGFSANLLRSIAKENATSNTVVSPINVYMALALLAEASDGSSRDQLLNAMGEESITTLSDSISNIWEKNVIKNDHVTSSLGSSLWLSDLGKYNQKTVDRINSIYHSEVFSGQMGSSEYNGKLHDWMNEHTGNMLKEQIGSLGFNPETVASVVSTIYFKDAWVNSFSAASTYKDTFYGQSQTSKVDFMHQTEKGQVYTGNKFTAAELNMFGGYSMMFVLPNEESSVSELYEDNEAMSFILSLNDELVPRRYRISYSIPKFDVSSQLGIIHSLRAMGITDIFEEAAADFSPLCDMQKVIISDIIHGARVKVDEDGCEAAAYTIGMLNSTSFTELDNIEFNVNRPFIFIIRNNEGTPLFVGNVYNLK